MFCGRRVVLGFRVVAVPMMVALVVTVSVVLGMVLWVAMAAQSLRWHDKYGDRLTYFDGVSERPLAVFCAWVAAPFAFAYWAIKAIPKSQRGFLWEYMNPTIVSERKAKADRKAAREEYDALTQLLADGSLDSTTRDILCTARESARKRIYA